ncbi:hypothetical protein [Georgenia deserti]|uniref:Capsular polysaccharide biosynthesis protein n=1 Tax=Georgenia deserti TaxID=2093781 RepID=A0ABW4LBS3_9MICO
MTVQDTLRGLLRRWYIVVPGLLVAAGLVVWSWQSVPPEYERTSRQLLIPGEASLPVVEEGEANPFLYLSGLDSAADVLVSAVGSEDVVRDVTGPYPGATVEVGRDPHSSGPVVMITVVAQSDDDAGAVMDEMLVRSGQVLANLQQTEEVDAAAQVTISPIAVDSVGEPKERSRLVYAGAAGAGTALMTLVLAAAVDGLARRPRRDGRTRSDRGAPDTDPDPNEATDVQHPGDGFSVEIVKLLDDAATAEARHRESPRP